MGQSELDRAIAYFEQKYRQKMSEIERAIYNLEQMIFGAEWVHSPYVNAIELRHAKTALTALREAKRRAEGCVECNWIDPGLAWTGEDKPVYCKRCGRCLHDPQQQNGRNGNGET